MANAVQLTHAEMSWTLTLTDGPQQDLMVGDGGDFPVTWQIFNCGPSTLRFFKKDGQGQGHLLAFENWTTFMTAEAILHVKVLESGGALKAIVRAVS
jgi:hypothetical protein